MLELLKLAAQNKESFDFLEHYKLNSSIFKANFMLILQNIGTIIFHLIKEKNILYSWRNLEHFSAQRALKPKPQS